LQQHFFLFLNMSSSNISDIETEINTINWTSLMFAQCWSTIMFILSLIGHSLSIYVFTRPVLRRNPCARYFLASAVTGYYITFVIIPLRTLQAGYNINVFLYSIPVCKILSFISSSIRYSKS
jgi:hypothetical protein